ncbi:MAG: NUDIX hydrolase [Pseudomonadales bacterium]|nr:NUDIX hydrolase [Pseudomonadales bacterium]
MEDQWLAWAKRLQAISSTGVFFGASDFDRERYEEIAAIADNMLAQLGQVPLQTIAGLIPDFGEGYATPKVDVRGAIVEDNKILLVRERLDGKWTLPGGYADVGISAADNIVKEIREEASIDVIVKRPYAIIHKARHAYDADARDFYKLYFLCERTGEAPPSPGMETVETGFFPADRLPVLSTGRVIKEHIELAFRHHASPTLPVTFD